MILYQLNLGWSGVLRTRFVRVQSENQCTGVHLSDIPNLEDWRA